MVAEAGEVLTVYLVDDDADIRSALSFSLSMRGYQVETFASGPEFLAALRPAMRGCLVLDYGMPGMNGLELQQRLNDLKVDIPVIFITGHGGVPESVRAIKAGALDFLQKPFGPAELIERIEAAFAITRARLTVEERSRRDRMRFDSLTQREREIVARIVARPSAISSKEIAADLGISPRTIDHHRARILEKLNMRSVAELISEIKRPE